MAKKYFNYKIKVIQVREGNYFSRNLKRNGYKFIKNILIQDMLFPL